MKAGELQMLVDGLSLAGMVANILAAPGTTFADPVGALAAAEKTPGSVAASTRARYAEAGMVKAVGEVCQCHSSDVQWGAYRADDGRPVLVCPYCERLATPEEIHEAMVQGTVGVLDELPGLEPLREAARERLAWQALTEEDVRLGLVTLRESIVERKREQAAKVALKRILGRTPTEKEIQSLARAPAPPPDTSLTCAACGGDMPWSRRLGAYWCQTCSDAEYPLADQLVRLRIPTA